MMDWTDANKKVAHAKRRTQELLDTYNAWENDRGLLRIEIKDDELAKYSWFAGMQKEPVVDLSLLAGDVFGALRDALDYVAWQVFLAGGGDRDGKQANQVYFPIAVDQAAFDKQVKKIPTAWPAAIERLHAAQPFNQTNGVESVLPALHAINNPSKHRELSLVTAGTFSQSATFPKLPDDLALSIMLIQPWPVLKPNSFDLVAKVGIIRKVGDDSFQTVRWSEGVTLDQPPRPTLELTFTNGNGEIALGAVPEVVAHVESIVGSFAHLDDPDESEV
ncbi:hypothetical protein ACWESM_16320 [Nocardia sp. NPDC003999]